LNPPAAAAAARSQRLIENPSRGRTVTLVDTDKNAKPSFETALARLEVIVDAMEQGDVPLADLLAKYEEGTKLLKVCETRLKDAELKIEKLKKSKDGGAGFESFEPARSE